MVILLGLKVFNFYNSNMFSRGRNAQVTVVENLQSNLSSFINTNI